jgi:hypothetical protein
MHISTHAQNGFADRPKQTACMLFHGHYFIIDTDETRFLRGPFSIAAHLLKFLCTLHKNEVMCIIPQHNKDEHGAESMTVNIKKDLN